MISNEELLGAEERQALKRFLFVLEDIGIQASMVMAIANTAGNGAGAAAEALGAAIRDVLGVGEREIASAAPSLGIVCAVTPASMIPADLRLSDDIVNKCLEAYWGAVRAQ